MPAAAALVGLTQRARACTGDDGSTSRHADVARDSVEHDRSRRQQSSVFAVCGIDTIGQRWRRKQRYDRMPNVSFSEGYGKIDMLGSSGTERVWRPTPPDRQQSDRMAGTEDSVVALIIKELLKKILYKITGCFQVNFHGTGRGRPLENSKMGIPQKARRGPPRETTSHRAIVLTEVMSKWYATCVFSVCKG